MWAPWTGAFVDRLKALGWIDGQTVKLEFRWSEGRPELQAQFAQEFAALNPSAIVAGGTAIPALMKVTSTIPIVFFALDPLGAGMVKSLARPGGNMTGISLQTLDAANKRFELLREVFPNMRRLAIMADAADPQTMLERNTVRALASKFAIDPIPLEIRRTEDIEPAFTKLKSEQADALAHRLPRSGEARRFRGRVSRHRGLHRGLPAVIQATVGDRPSDRLVIE
jgi:putative tryptophan/tyrosine transport system substrate-binding protein